MGDRLARHGGGLKFWVGLWLAVCASGFVALMAYGHEEGAGAAVDPGARWGGALPLDAERVTLIMFVHPRCPCTMASMNELERLQGMRQGAFTTRLVYYEPEGADDSWRSTRLWRSGARLRDTTLHRDPAGRIAAAAGARTSGRTAVYAPDGRLLFWGGLTPARGHEGASAGRDAVLAILDGLPATTPRTPAYGCTLLSDDACEALCGAGAGDGNADG